MPFHGHSFDIVCLVLRHVDADGSHRLCHVENLVHAHVDVVEFEQPLQLLVHFQSHKSDAYMCLYPSACEVEHGPYLYL